MPFARSVAVELHGFAAVAGEQGVEHLWVQRAMDEPTEPSASPALKPSRHSPISPFMGAFVSYSKSSGFVQMTAFASATSTVMIVFEVPSVILLTAIPSLAEKIVFSPRTVR